MKTAVPLACFLSVIRPPGVQYENALLQIAPVDKSKCPFVKDNNDIGFQLFTRHNPTVYQELMVDDDEKLFASSMDFNDRTVLYFHAFMEQPDDGSGIMVREALMQRGDTNVIMVDASRLEAGPWYFTAAHNTWYIGQFAARFIDYLVTRGLNLNNTQLVGHSLGAQAAGVAGGHLQTGRVARITGLDPALPLFDHVSLEQRLDHTDAHFVDVIHTDAGIFGFPAPIGHVDFYPNGGKSPQPGCELEVVIPQHLLLNKCDGRTHIQGFYTFYLQTSYPKSEKGRNSRLIEISNRNHMHDIVRKTKPPQDTNDTPSMTQDQLHKIHRNTETNKYVTNSKQQNQMHDLVINTQINKEMMESQAVKNNQFKSKIQSDLARDRFGSMIGQLRNLVTRMTFKEDVKGLKENTKRPKSNSQNQLHNLVRNLAHLGQTLQSLQDIQDNSATFTQDYINQQETIIHNQLHELVKDTRNPDQIVTDGSFDELSIKPRRKRFTQFINRSEIPNNALFRMIQFLSRNRIPILSFMREINTIVKSANGEFSHFSKESYFGQKPPTSGFTYSVELGGGNKLVGLVKKILGFGSGGDRLTVISS